MLEGFYTALSGMLVQQRSLSVLGNNIVNSQTPGYKAERVVSTTFQEELMIRQENGRKINIGSANPIKLVEEVASDFNSGLLESTERPFDIALVGNGYFNVLGAPPPTANNTPPVAEGEEAEPAEQVSYLTRNGNFDIDSEGYLILPGVGRVLGTEGELQIGGSNFIVDNQGYVYGSDGEIIDKLLITMPPTDEEGVTQKLQKSTNGLYLSPEGAEEVSFGEVEVVQMALEVANFDVNREYTMIMDAQRAFQACSSALKMLDTINQKTATQIGNIN